MDIHGYYMDYTWTYRATTWHTHGHTGYYMAYTWT